MTGKPPLRRVEAALIDAVNALDELASEVAETHEDEVHRLMCEVEDALRKVQKWGEDREATR